MNVKGLRVVVLVVDWVVVCSTWLDVVTLCSSGCEVVPIASDSVVTSLVVEPFWSVVVWDDVVSGVVDSGTVTTDVYAVECSVVPVVVVCECWVVPAVVDAKVYKQWRESFVYT